MNFSDSLMHTLIFLSSDPVVVPQFLWSKMFQASVSSLNFVLWLKTK